MCLLTAITCREVDTTEDLVTYSVTVDDGLVLCISNAGFESYLAADAIDKSVYAVNQSITATKENPNATANVKVLVETIQKVRFST